METRKAMTQRLDSLPWHSPFPHLSSLQACAVPEHLQHFAGKKRERCKEGIERSPAPGLVASA